MITLRRSNERGHFDFGWLNTFHSFSFGEYHDPRHMGWGPLRVINDDRVAPGGGFPTHPHRDMEIITYVLDGKLEHRDSIGNGSVIKPGDVQRMSAGTGIRHSEFNGSRDEAVRLLQIWIHPERPGMAPSYEQKNFPAAEKQGRLRLVGSRDGRDGAVVIHRDVDLYAAVLAADDAVTHAIGPRRLGWLQVARGTVALNGETLAEGDAAAIEADTALSLTGSAAGAEVLLFDMAA